MSLPSAVRTLANEQAATTGAWHDASRRRCPTLRALRCPVMGVGDHSRATCCVGAEVIPRFLRPR
jgi:hypothetical protein